MYYKRELYDARVFDTAMDHNIFHHVKIMNGARKVTSDQTSSIFRHCSNNTINYIRPINRIDFQTNYYTDTRHL